MAPRNSQDGKGPFKYNYTPSNCDGFNVTAMCRHYDKDCRHGSCWHMDRVRQMVRRWFEQFVPCRAQIFLERERPEPKPLTNKELAAMNKKADELYRACREKHDRLYGPEPQTIRHDWGSNGIGYSPRDEDSVGSWGRVVRIVEDSR